MANPNKTTETTQYIMNRVKHENLDALDVIPFTQSTDGSSATPVSTSAPLPIKVINSDGTDNSLSTGGQIGQKVQVVGDGDKYVRGIQQEGNSLNQVEPVFVGFKDSSGNSRGLTGKVLDSRQGADVQTSSIAAKQLADFRSSVTQLLAGQEKVFSPGGTRATYYDLDGYMGVSLSFIDNSSGGDGGKFYLRWSNDGTNTNYNDPGDGTGGTNYQLIDCTSSTGTNPYAGFIPRRARYLNIVFINGAVDQGTTYPQSCNMDISLFPGFFTNSVELLGKATVVGSVNPTDSGVLISGIDTAAPTNAPLPWGMTVNAGGQGIGQIEGVRTVFTGNALVTTQKLATTSSQSSVTAGTTSSTLVASSTSRLRVLAYNNGTYPVYYRLSSTACTTASGGYTGIIWPGTAEPIGVDVPYSGAVTCITPAGTGNSTISLSTI